MPRENNPQSTEEGGVNKQDKQNSTVDRNSPNTTGGNTAGGEKPQPGGRTVGTQEEGMAKEG